MFEKHLWKSDILSKDAKHLWKDDILSKDAGQDGKATTCDFDISTDYTK